MFIFLCTFKNASLLLSELVALVHRSDPRNEQIFTLSSKKCRLDESISKTYNTANSSYTLSNNLSIKMLVLEEQQSFEITCIGSDKRFGLRQLSNRFQDSTAEYVQMDFL